MKAKFRAAIKDQVVSEIRQGEVYWIDFGRALGFVACRTPPLCCRAERSVQSKPHRHDGCLPHHLKSKPVPVARQRDAEAGRRQLPKASIVKVYK